MTSLKLFMTTQQIPYLISILEFTREDQNIPRLNHSPAVRSL